MLVNQLRNFFVKIENIHVLRFKWIKKLMSDQSYSDEKELLLQLRMGHKSAFEELYSRYKLRLTGNLLRILKSPELVEDVIQDVFLGVWENRLNIDPEQSIKSYLYASTANRAKNIFRKASYDQKFKDFLLPQWKEYYTHVEELLFAQENNQLLEELLNNLSPQQQKVFRLCKMEGKSYKEVAQLLGISEATVNTHISKANSVLKNLVNHNPNFLFTVFLNIILLSY